MNLANLTNLPHFVSWDFLMVLVLLMVFVVLGFFWKKKRMLVVILALYLSRLFLSLFPIPEQVKNFKSGDLTGELLIFWALFFILFIIFATGGISLKAVSAKRLKRKQKTRYLALKGAFYGFFAAGLFISFSLILMAPGFVGGLSLIVNYLFVVDIARIAWAILPLIVMMTFK